jgi:hypothetical protein
MQREEKANATEIWNTKEPVPVRYEDDPWSVVMI